MHLQQTESEDAYTIDELEHLVTALGLPQGVFKQNLPTTVYEDNSVTVKDLLHYCDLRYFHHDLHFTVNLKSDAYNIEVLKKGIVLVATRRLSFVDLQSVRLAFEAYEDYDQRGMSICERTFLRTLKMCGRVISPQKLTNKLRHIRSSFKEKGRIQLYEFLDLLMLCEFTPEDIPDRETKVLNKTWRNVYCVDNFKQFVIPKDKKLWKTLNEQYRNEELQYGYPILLSENFKEKPVTVDDFDLQVKLSNEAYQTTRKKLRESDKRIKLSRGGFTSTRPKQSLSSSTSRSKTTKPDSSTVTADELTWANYYQTGTLSHFSPSTITAVPSYRTAPIGSVISKEKIKKPRPQSCPPVVNDHSCNDMKHKLNELRFNMHTQKQRWSDNFKKEISEYLPNHEVVMARLNKEPKAPTGKRKIYRKTRPSPTTLHRLAEPRPMLPHSHVSHCAAITMGIGDDDHALTLQRHGNKIVTKLQSKNTEKGRRKHKQLKLDQRGWNAFSKCRPTLLERLLYEVDHDLFQDEDNIVAQTEIIEGDDEISEIEDGICSNVEECSYDEEQEEINRHENIRREILERIMKPRDRVCEALKLMQEDFSRLYVDPEERPTPEFSEHPTDADIPPCDDAQGRRSRPLSGRSVDSQTTEVTEFEKFIGDSNNLRLPDDVCLGKSKKTKSELKRMRKSYKRISHRFKDEDMPAYLKFGNTNS